MGKADNRLLAVIREDASERSPLLNGRPRADSVLTATEDKEELLPITQLTLICIWRATNVSVMARLQLDSEQVVALAGPAASSGSFSLR